MPFFGIPLRNGVPLGLGSVAGFGSAPQFSPADLFLGGINGAWYDPSDSTTLFSDTAGTTPVAEPGAGALVNVGLMLDKSQGLVLGSELVTNGDFSNGTTGWTATNSGSMTADSGGYRITNIIAGASTITQSLSTTSGKWYCVTLDVLGFGGGASSGQVRAGTTAGGFNIAFASIGLGLRTFYFLASSATTFISVAANSGNIGAYGAYDNISVRELPGNHAISYNSTTARPELSARVNLLTYSEQFNLWSGAGTTVSANATTAPDGTLTADKMVETATTGLHYRLVGSLTTQVASYTLSVSAKAAERKWLILWYSGSGGFEPYAYFDLENGVIGNKSVSAVASILPQSNGFYRCQITITGQAISNASFVVSVSDADNNNPNQTYLGDSSKGIFVWGADLRPTNIGSAVPAYQRIADQYTYDNSASFPRYLRFDGVDDGMSTPANLNLSGTDKATVFAGVRKLSDAAQGVVAELSATIASNNGTFLLAAPDGATQTYGWDSKGTTQVDAVASSLAAPRTDVLTGIGDIAGDSCIIRVNGANADTETGDQGTGNYGTYPLYIGSRNNASLRLNGHLYSLIVRGAATDASTISATETWVAGRTGISIS